ncbi:hypothetical protein CDAR_492841 [Caerostris darwini]|uniref:Uncharacterized protein n=1 Tax=Caerostris darwini TaxID=1538125 RepID=A0AAV4TBR0_9ARAC|nr:hypothetical protein CDAR_478911 [Caerostris darwini]GIY43124.1 hypothetical protein CDAR_492841 [Caerostris darwini]
MNSFPSHTPLQEGSVVVLARQSNLPQSTLLLQSDPPYFWRHFKELFCKKTRKQVLLFAFCNCKSCALGSDFYLHQPLRNS